MGGTIALAWFALRLPEVGGIEGLRDRLPESTFQFLPTVGAQASDAGQALALPVAAFIAFVGVQWWASWYPGQEASGDGYVAQRMMSAKDERHSMLATLWFTLAHYCLRPWPWILVGLASMLLYPTVADREAAYVMVLRDHLPAGWRGLLLAGFFAAYMSTIGTQLNWGCSYVINDFYRRFLRPDAAERHYIAASRITTLVLMVLGGVTTFYLDSIRQAWEFILESGAGVGLVLILRWYWWRVNAWSEVAALVAPAVGFAYLKLFTDVAFPSTLFYLVTWTTVWWLLVTFLTPPEPMEHLISASIDRFALAGRAGRTSRMPPASRQPNGSAPWSSTGLPAACSCTARSSASARSSCARRWRLSRTRCAPSPRASSSTKI